MQFQAIHLNRRQGRFNGLMIKHLVFAKEFSIDNSLPILVVRKDENDVWPNRPGRRCHLPEEHGVREQHRQTAGQPECQSAANVHLHPSREKTLRSVSGPHRLSARLRCPRPRSRRTAGEFDRRQDWPRVMRWRQASVQRTYILTRRQFPFNGGGSRNKAGGGRVHFDCSQIRGRTTRNGF